MRKGAFIFALFYLLSAVGYGLEFHYCLGQVTDVNIAWLDTSCACDDDQDHVAPPCCDEKEFFVQIEQDHQASNASKISSVTLPIVAIIQWNLLEFHSVAKETIALPLKNGPPPQAPLFEQYCARLVYS